MTEDVIAFAELQLGVRLTEEQKLLVRWAYRDWTPGCSPRWSEGMRRFRAAGAPETPSEHYRIPRTT